MTVNDYMKKVIVAHLMKFTPVFLGVRRFINNPGIAVTL